MWHSIAYYSPFPKPSPVGRGISSPRPSPRRLDSRAFGARPPTAFFDKSNTAVAVTNHDAKLLQRHLATRAVQIELFYRIFEHSVQLSRVLEYSTDTGITGSY